MFSDLNRFFRHTAVYTVGNVMHRAASFVLVPIYARYLSPAEYGSLELVYVTAAIVQAMFSAGMGHSALRFYFDYENPKDKNSVISTAMLGSFGLSLVGSLLLFLFGRPLSSAVFGSATMTTAFRIVAISMVLEISREISLAFVRARQKPGFFIVTALVQLLAQVAANLYTVVHMHMGVVGILTGNLIATFAVWIILTTYTVRLCGWQFETSKLWQVAKYGVPLTISVLSGTVFQSLDRFFLNAYRDLQTTGQYALALRISAALPVLLVLPFTTSYGAFRFSVMKQDSAPRIYSKVTSYFAMASALVVLVFSALSEEIVRLISSPAYWEAFRIVPVLLIPGALGGITYCLQTGIYVHKKTSLILWITVASGLVNLACVFALVPRWGMMGTAMAGLVTAVYMMAHTYIASQKLLPIRYELGRIAKIVGCAMTLGAIALQVHMGSVWQGVVVKLLLIGAFPVLMIALRAYTPDEKTKLMELWTRTSLRWQSRAVSY